MIYILYTLEWVFRGNRKLTLDGVNIGVEQYGATLQYGLDVQTNEWSKEPVLNIFYKQHKLLKICKGKLHKCKNVL